MLIDGTWFFPFDDSFWCYCVWMTVFCAPQVRPKSAATPPKSFKNILNMDKWEQLLCDFAVQPHLPPNCSNNLILLSWSLKVQEVYLDDKGKEPMHWKNNIWWQDQNPCKFPRGKGKKGIMLSKWLLTWGFYSLLCKADLNLQDMKITCAIFYTSVLLQNFCTGLDFCLCPGFSHI